MLHALRRCHAKKPQTNQKLLYRNYVRVCPWASTSAVYELIMASEGWIGLTPLPLQDPGPAADWRVGVMHGLTPGQDLQISGGPVYGNQLARTSGRTATAAAVCAVPTALAHVWACKGAVLVLANGSQGRLPHAGGHPRCTGAHRVARIRPCMRRGCACRFT